MNILMNADWLPGSREGEHTYFILWVQDRVVKIGRSANVARRYTELRQGNPGTLIVLGVTKGDLEKEIHEKFSDLRSRSNAEYFEAEEKLMRYIAENSTVYGVQSKPRKESIDPNADPEDRINHWLDRVLVQSKPSDFLSTRDLWAAAVSKFELDDSDDGFQTILGRISRQKLTMCAKKIALDKFRIELKKSPRGGKHRANPSNGWYGIGLLRDADG